MSVGALLKGLVGVGGWFATSLWLLSLLLAWWWLGRQVVQRRFVTVPSSVVIFTFVLPVLLQYPFIFSPLNGLTIGPLAYAHYVPFIDRAFLLTMLGLACFAIGYQGAGGRPQPFAPSSVVAAGLRVWAQDIFLRLMSAFLIGIFVALFALGLFRGGLGALTGGGLRGIAFQAPAIRPLYNLAHIFLPITIAIQFLVWFQHRSRVLLLLAIVNLGLGVMTGARGVVFGGLMLYVTTMLAYPSLQHRLRIGTALKLVPLAAVILLLVVYLGDVREGRLNPLLSVATFGAKLVYGTNFSDQRDFTWVLSDWNGEFFYGRTQLAGILSFIPSAISSFRAEWNWGVITTTMTGLDPKITPGLRTGPFGEPYFNFGLPGVILGGLLYGYVIRRLHNATVLAVATRAAPEARMEILAALIVSGLVGNLLNTAGFYALYLTVGFLVGLQLFDVVLRSLRAPRRPLASPASPTRHGAAL